MPNIALVSSQDRGHRTPDVRRSGVRIQPPLFIAGRRTARIPQHSRFHPAIEARIKADIRRFGISRSFAVAWHVAHSMGLLPLVAKR